MDEYVKAASGVNHLLRLISIKNKAVKIVGHFDIEVALSARPRFFHERPELEYEPAKRGQALCAKGGHAWLHLTGVIPAESDPENTYVHLGIRGEGTIFDASGTPVGAVNTISSFIDAFPSPIGRKAFALPKSCFENNVLDLWAEVSNNGLLGRSFGKAKLGKAFLFSVNPDIKDFYFDYLTVYFALQAAESRQDKNRLTRMLDKLYRLYRKDAAAARAVLKESFADANDSSVTVTALGHAHLDLAWLWNIDETVRKAGRTFSRQIYNLEKYPSYIFGASQPVEYLFVKQSYPALYEKIKEKAAQGRLEPLGGMWTEPDVNLTSGESLIRQIYYGKKFFKEEFGFEPKVCWLPDSFGFSASLPQILKKCGLDFFMTVKLTWNQLNRFPHTSFVWQGIDSSEVVAHIPPEGNYASDIAPFSIKKALRLADSNAKSILMPFGSGDGGGGAHEIHLEMAERAKSLKGYPSVIQRTAGEFFAELSRDKENLPVYKGELYLEAHQGTYTVQAAQKKLNRVCENLLHEMELIGALCLKKGMPYDFARAEKLWKDALKEQFHDILPGSSCQDVHKESAERYKKLLAGIKSFIGENAKHLIKDTRALSAVNLSPVRQKGYFRTINGWVYADLEPYSAKKVSVKEIPPALLSCGECFISNDLLAVTFDKKGTIVSLVNKFTNKEFCANALNRLTLYKDKRRFWNACDIDYGYYKKKITLPGLVSFSYYVDGASVVRKNVYKIGKSSIVQKIILTINSPIVVFETIVRWHEKHKMLRADFFPAEYGNKAICGIQMGNIERSTKCETEIEKGQLEVCAHKYLDVSNGSYGTALLAPVKYGYRAKDGNISLNLLRSPVFPDPTADRGVHKFSYAFYPHNGDAFSGNVAQVAYAFDNPLKFVKGDLVFKSLAKCEEVNIIIETIKPAENGGYILRAFENEGRETSAGISVDFPFIYAYECDMLENPIEQTNLNNVRFSPYEIKTILLK